MKTSIYFILIILVSCKKPGAEKTAAVDDLKGTWELYQSNSGMSPLTTYTPGNGFEISFSDSTYSIKNNGSLSNQGTYHLENDSVMNQYTCALQAPHDNSPNRIVYHDNPRSHRTSFEFVSGRLKIMSGCFPLDGGWSLYNRKFSGSGNILQDLACPKPL